jgi:hypothetical protein
MVKTNKVDHKAFFSKRQGMVLHPRTAAEISKDNYQNPLSYNRLGIENPSTDYDYQYGHQKQP